MCRYYELYTFHKFSRRNLNGLYGVLFIVDPDNYLLVQIQESIVLLYEKWVVLIKVLLIRHRLVLSLMQLSRGTPLAGESQFQYKS